MAREYAELDDGWDRRVMLDVILLYEETPNEHNGQYEESGDVFTIFSLKIRHGVRG